LVLVGRRRRGIVVLSAALASACAHGSAPAPPPTPPRAEAPRPPEDPAAKLIAEADAHLATGLSEIKQGHLNGARAEFDQAVDTYLTAPGGAYASAPLGDAYRRTLDVIQTAELEALAAGDAFAEADAEPASIDEVSELAADAEAPATPDVRALAVEAVSAEANDLPIELNDSVLACINLYQGRLRDWFNGALSRGQRYLPQIRAVFAAEGIPQDLAYLAMVESAFKPNAYSRAKAKGVWQFIADTGRRYGLQLDWWVDERSDTEKATRAAARYLKDLHEMFGDWNLAVAAYNAGELNVQRGLARYKVKDFWSLSRTRALRRETKSYVPLIHAAVVVAKAPEKYGFEIEPETAPVFERVPIEGAFDLRVVAECAATPLDDVQQLNPELRRLATPANRTFDLRVPAGRGADTVQCLAAIPAEKRVRFRTHVVGRGQTLASIARANGVMAKDIADANGLAAGRPVRAGTELIIPIDPRARAAAAAPRRSGQRAAAPELADSDRSVKVTYLIKPGDTLAGIASQYGTSVQKLQTWNGLQTTRIAAGARLVIYTTRTASTREGGGRSAAAANQP
jgi:membrane-bound lytic murein transglycosylase D